MTDFEARVLAKLKERGEWLTAAELAHGLYLSDQSLTSPDQDRIGEALSVLEGEGLVESRPRELTQAQLKRQNLEIGHTRSPLEWRATGDLELALPDRPVPADSAWQPAAS